jgi:Uma2 family endonuclease
VSVATRVSLEEFLSNPDIHYYDFHELHNGEVVVVSPPSGTHVDMQVRLEAALRSALSGFGYAVLREFYYTLASNSRRADVAAVLESRRQVNRNKVFRGGPDLVVEILSPSNTTLDLDLLRTECFQEGSKQFWVINPNLRTVTVYKPSNAVSMYDFGSANIPLDEFATNAVIPVAEVFQT